MQTTHPHNFISDQISDVDRIVEKIPTVQNTADLWDKTVQVDPPVNLIQESQNFWNNKDSVTTLQFINGVAEGRYINKHHKFQENILYMLIQAYKESIKTICRNNSIQLAAVNNLLEILDNIHENICYVLSRDKAQLDSMKMLANLHGIICGVITNETRYKKSDE